MDTATCYKVITKDGIIREIPATDLTRIPFFRDMLSDVIVDKSVVIPAPLTSAGLDCAIALTGPDAAVLQNELDPLSSLVSALDYVGINTKSISYNGNLCIITLIQDRMTIYTLPPLGTVSVNENTNTITDLPRFSDVMTELRVVPSGQIAEKSKISVEFNNTHNEYFLDLIPRDLAGGIPILINMGKWTPMYAMSPIRIQINNGQTTPLSCVHGFMDDLDLRNKLINAEFPLTEYAYNSVEFTGKYSLLEHCRDGKTIVAIQFITAIELESVEIIAINHKTEFSNYAYGRVYPKLAGFLPFNDRKKGLIIFSDPTPDCRYGNCGITSRLDNAEFITGVPTRMNIVMMRNFIPS